MVWMFRINHLLKKIETKLIKCLILRQNDYSCEAECDQQLQRKNRIDFLDKHSSDGLVRKTGPIVGRVIVWQICHIIRICDNITRIIGLLRRCRVSKVWVTIFWRLWRIYPLLDITCILCIETGWRRLWSSYELIKFIFNQ
jgi:hypothetical protein